MKCVDIDAQVGDVSGALDLSRYLSYLLPVR